MTILPDAAQKRELCYRIAKIYRQRIMGRKNVQESNYENSIYPNFLVGNVSIDFTKIFGSLLCDDFERKARKYESFADSKVRIHFIRTSSLQETLNRLKS